MSPLLVKICKDLKLVRCPPFDCFTLITRTAPCLRQLPSCVAVYPCDSDRDVFYVAEPLSSILDAIGILSDEGSQCANPKHSYEFL